MRYSFSGLYTFAGAEPDTGSEKPEFLIPWPVGGGPRGRLDVEHARPRETEIASTEEDEQPAVRGRAR